MLEYFTLAPPFALEPSSLQYSGYAQGVIFCALLALGITLLILKLLGIITIERTYE